MRTDTRLHVGVTGSVIVVLLCFYGIAQAQTAGSSLPNLSLLIGERIEVTDEAGSVFTGKLLRVSESSLVLEAARNERAAGGPVVVQKQTEMSLHEIRGISRWEKDSVANGILLGAIFGVLTSVVVAAVPNTDEPMIAYTFFPGLGIGTAVGWIGDAARNRKIQIFPPKAASPRVTIAPLLAGGRSGVTVNLSY